MRELVSDALRRLGIRSLVLAIHDPSFPAAPDDDVGRGSPYAAGGARFVRFARDLGFTGLQLGPQGQTSADNPSPYDGTLFSRNTHSIALAPLAEDPAWGGLLPRALLVELVAAAPRSSASRACHRAAAAAIDRALRAAFAAFCAARARGGAADLAARLAAFRRQNEAWLERDALFAALSAQHGAGLPAAWRGAPDIERRLFAPRPGEEAACAARLGALRARHGEFIEFYAFCQLIAHAQHAALRRRTAELDLTLYGDLQIGVSPRDLWSYPSLFLAGYLMGAPPSRTNPEGQAWGYPVLDPDQYAGPPPRPALDFLRARMRKMFDAYDGVRIDHPHGLVCPWVYEGSDPDPLRAVRAGARLFSSPDLPEHPALARYAIARPDQLDRSLPRHADGWVRALTPDQVARYGALFDAIAACAREHGRAVTDLVCEVLSTQPYPLKAVLDRHGLGRFRVTQKADPDNSNDVYRSENAQESDWIMVGTHDTPPLWRLLPQWEASGRSGWQAAYLAERLAPSPAARGAMARALAADRAWLARATFADLFASRAGHVMVFFADLLGLTDIYNRPGTVSDANWSLRVPPDYEVSYEARRARGAALDLPGALAMALRARSASRGLSGEASALADKLDAAAAPLPGRPA